MKRTFWISVVVATLFGAVAHAEFHKGDFELSIAAAGTTPSNVDSFVFGGTAGLGWFATDNLELSVIQGVGYQDATENHWSGSTTGEVDWNFGFGKFAPFVGGFFTANYGDGVSATQAGGPDGGLKYFLSDNTILVAKCAYSMPTNGDDGTIGYSIGISWKF